MSNLLHIQQLELLLLSCKRVLEENGIVICPEMSEFIDDIIYNNEHIKPSDLLETIKLIKSEIIKQRKVFHLTTF